MEVLEEEKLEEDNEQLEKPVHSTPVEQTSQNLEMKKTINKHFPNMRWSSPVTRIATREIVSPIATVHPESSTWEASEIKYRYDHTMSLTLGIV